MTYTPTTWVDEVPSTSPVKYRIIDDVDGIVANSAQIALLTSVTPGTALNAANMNKLEQGLRNAELALAGRITTIEAHLAGMVITGGWTHTSWDGDSKNGGAAYAVQLADFSPASIPATVKMVLVRLSASWSAINSGSQIYFEGSPGARYLSLRGQVANVFIDACGWVPATGTTTKYLYVRTSSQAPTSVYLEISAYML